MKRMQKKQAGFTILEIGIVMVILISLVITFSSGLWEKQTASDIQLIETFFEKNVPDAIASCRMRKNNILENMTQAELLVCGGLAPNIVGLTWVATDVAAGLTTFTIDLTSMSEESIIGAAVAANLNAGNYRHIDTGGTGYASPTLTVLVRVR